MIDGIGRRLMQRCLARDPSTRPSLAALCVDLEDLALHAAQAVPTGQASGLFPPSPREPLPAPRDPFGGPGGGGAVHVHRSLARAPVQEAPLAWPSAMAPPPHPGVSEPLGYRDFMEPPAVLSLPEVTGVASTGVAYHPFG